MADTRFKKGMTPWNKGTVGVMKVNSGSFQPGQKAHNKKVPLEKTCPACGTVFYVKPSLSRVKSCSSRCARLGKKATLATRQKQSASLRGRLTHNVISRGSDRPAWKGANVSYRALHRWVEVYRGKPSQCEHCLSPSKGRYEWANKSGEYRRDLDDWLRLCKKCHVTYDRTKGTRQLATT